METKDFIESLELEPCPFCGEEIEKERIVIEVKTQYYDTISLTLICEKCNTIFKLHPKEIVGCSFREILTKIWNSRKG